MKNIMKKALLSLVLGLALVANARAQTIGPVTNGPFTLPLLGSKPITYTNGFNGTGPSLIRVKLSAPNILTTATLVLNGAQIMQLSDFAGGVTQVDRFVTLIGKNSFSFTIAGTAKQSATLTVFQVIMPTPSGVAPNPLGLTLGTSGALTATLSPVPTASGTLTVSSSNTAVATVPASIAFAANQGSVSIPVTTVGSGSTTVTASANGGSASATVNVNAPPTVSITSPANGAVFAAPASITITASAADSDGTIARVDFFEGATLLGTASAAPYSVSLGNVASGSHTYTARATDNLGGTTTSSAVSVISDAPPTVSITSPAAGALFTAPASITITASAADTDGAIAKVDFYQGATMIGTATAAPYSATTASLGSGTYSFTAVATDNSGATTTSAAVNVRVNAAPTVSLTSPANGGTFTAPASITISADAADTDGTVTSVAFYHEGTLISTVTAAPYSITWTGVPVGTYSLTAIASDDLGAMTTSAAVSVTVKSGVAQMYFIHPDHLNTPRAVSDASGRTVWRWDQTEPFGDSVPNRDPSGLGAFVLNLRFPGQYLDQETALDYNYFRHYDATIARYTSFDPLGLSRGTNGYGYVRGNPLRLKDTRGLFDEWPDPSGPPPMPTSPMDVPGNVSFGGGAIVMGGTGGMSASAGIVIGGGNVCSYKTVCGLVGYGFAAGFGPEAGIGVGKLCSGRYRSVGSFGVGGDGLIAGASGSGSGEDLTAGVAFAGIGGGSAGGVMACFTELICMKPCDKEPCRR
jgi:RHS repeat-associated protein